MVLPPSHPDAALVWHHHRDVFPPDKKCFVAEGMKPGWRLDSVPTYPFAWGVLMQGSPIRGSVVLYILIHQEHVTITWPMCGTCVVIWQHNTADNTWLHTYVMCLVTCPAFTVYLVQQSCNALQPGACQISNDVLECQHSRLVRERLVLIHIYNAPHTVFPTIFKAHNCIKVIWTIYGKPMW